MPRGRPPKIQPETNEIPMETVQEVKRGNKSWAPASTISFTGMEKGFRYKCVQNKPERIARHEQEGWEIVSRKDGAKTGNDPSVIDKLGRPVDTTVRVRDTILMRMPEEFAKSRENYYNEKTKRRTKAMREEAEQQVRATGAKVSNSSFQQETNTIY